MPDFRFFCLRGFMKSGTNWLEKLLNSHPQISCHGEFQFQQIVKPMQQMLQDLYLYQILGEGFRETVQERLENFIKESMIAAAATHDRPNIQVIGDRTPQTIEPLTLRNARYISIIRDGRDVLISRIFHLYNWPKVSRVFERFHRMETHLKAFQADPWYFRSNPEKLLEEEVLVKESITWWRDHLLADQQTVQQNPDLPVCFVKYEDLHRDTLAERNRLLDFLQVDPTLAAEISGELNPGFEQERPNEFFRKGAVGDWKKYITPQAKDWINEIAGQTLQEQGYIENLDW